MNDIALAHYQYYAATNNKTWLQARGWPIISAVAEFWASEVEYNQTTGRYVARNFSDPDEYSNHIDNGAFTNAGIKILFLRWASQLASVLGVDTPRIWTDIGNNIDVSVDPVSGIVLEFDGFNSTIEVKQGDVVLLTYPLEFSQSPTQALEDLDYYALRTSPNGPGMTYSIFSIDANTLSNGVGCASYTYLLASSQPYSRPPFYQFSEQTGDIFNDNGGTNPAFTFLTGHGGYLQ
jgi:trehalose/maltose hydrolase-like predicted phosphorylase